MANVFSDIFEAIRIIRQKKGTTETDIMTYVHDRLGKGVSIRTVLKTMKTLNRLVDDGLLIRKGKRYLLPLPSDSSQEKKDDNEDECCMDDEDDEDNEDDNNDDEGEEDEDQEEDDDDDDDGDCNMDDEVDGKEENGDDKEEKDPCEMDEEVNARGWKEEGGTDWDYKHIDSKMKKCMKSDLNPVAGSFIRSKRQRHGGTRRNQHYEDEFDDLSRNRSPARESSDEIDLMMDVEEGLHASAGRARFINNDLAFEYEEGDRPEGFDVYRYKSPNGPPPPNTPGVHVERRESCCSEIVLKVDELAEARPDFQGEAKTKLSEEGDKKHVKQPKKRAQDGGDEGCKKEKTLRRDNSAEKTTKQSSICNLCKKKKPPGYEDDCV